MRIVAYNSSIHYSQLVKTWRHFGWLACPKEFLPKIGFVAESELGDFIAALFMYCDPGSVALIDWAVGSQSATKEEKHIAFQRLFNMMKQIAISNKCSFLYSVTAIKAFQDKLTSWGMLPVETGMKSFVFPLNNTSVDFLKD